MKITIRPYQKDPSRFEADIQLPEIGVRRRYVVPSPPPLTITEKLAEKWAEAKAGQLIKEHGSKPKAAEPEQKVLTLREFWPRYVSDYLATKSPSTRSTYESHWRLHIEPILGSKKIIDIDELQLDKLKISLSEKVCNKPGSVQGKRSKYKPVKKHAKADKILSPVSVNAVLGTVTSMMDRAFRWRLVGRVPECELIDVASSEDSKIERSKYYDRKESDAICKAAYELGLQFYAFVLIGLDGALRVSEICALRWENIDFGSKEISVSEAVINVKGGEVVKLPKMNKKGIIPMSDRLFNALTALYNASSEKKGRVLQRQELSDKSTRGIHKEGGVSPAVLKYWTHAITTEAAKIDPRIKPNYNPHRFRHSAGTRVGSETGNVMAVKQLLRHGSLVTSRATPS